jgi:hypothetical protein
MVSRNRRKDHLRRISGVADDYSLHWKGKAKELGTKESGTGGYRSC